MTQSISIKDINLDQSPKVRHEVNTSVVDEYAHRYEDGETLPPIHVFWVNGELKYLLADGAHRCFAKVQIGASEIEAEIHEGGYIEALAYALTANSKHGLPRSNADKRACIRLALKQWPEKSNLSLAQMCDVDDKTVGSVRSEMEAAKAIEPAPVRVSSSGRTVSATREERPEPEPAQEPVADIAPTDFSGTEIPVAVRKYWSRTEEIKDVMRNVGFVVSSLRQAQKDEDPMFAEVNISAAIGDLDKVIASLQCAIPYSVCTQCKGHPEVHKGGCRLCMGRGLISKFRYERLVPEELKKIKEGKK